MTEPGGGQAGGAPLPATPCRLRVDPPAAGAWNMALDEALLDRAAEHGEATLRLYRWAPATLSLGYFQRYDDRHAHAASRHCAVVRRHSGGGAIVHDHELTYSLAMPPSSRWERYPYFLYDAAHETLRESLMGLCGDPRRWRVELCSDGADRADAPFLCFLRRARGDLLVRSAVEGPGGSAGGLYKVAGSSQRKRRGAVLQHGSVLLGQSSAAPELPGFAELTGQPLSFDALAQDWAPRLALRLNLMLSDARGADPRLEAAAQAICEKKFGSPGWLGRR